MTMRNRATALVLGLMLAAPAFADSVGVSRCDREDGGVFRPGLLTVERDGTRTFYPVGENGLTETIIFNEGQAIDWIRAQGLFPEGTMFGDYANVICGLPCEECAPDEEAPDEQEEPDDETRPDQTDG